MGDLESCAKLAAHWERHGLAIPLIVPDQEFRQSLDAFPLEYGEILRAHERLFGADPFERAVISHEDLRRACETQVKSHLLHLREGFIESGGRPESVAELVRASAPAFGALLRNVARLAGGTPAGREAATRDGARAAALPEAVVAGMLTFERTPSIQTTDAARLFPEYLAAVEHLARTVDAWRP